MMHESSVLVRVFVPRGGKGGKSDLAWGVSWSCWKYKLYIVQQ